MDMVVHLQTKPQRWSANRNRQNRQVQLQVTADKEPLETSDGGSQLSCFTLGSEGCRAAPKTLRRVMQLRVQSTGATVRPTL